MKHKINSLLLSGIVLISVFLSNNFAQQDITFRTISDQDHVTNHYGNMQIYGLGQGLSNSILYSTYNSTDATDKSAIYGYSVPQPYWGIGGCFIGGYKGVIGDATISGSGTRYAGHFSASGGNGSNYGIYSAASGPGTAYAGYFNGNVTVTGTFSNPSDIKFKKDIAPLSGSLEKVLSLKPKSYFYDASTYKGLNFSEKKQHGLIAQDVEAIFPELVSEEVIPKPTLDSLEKLKDIEEGSEKKENETYKSINYIGLIPVLINAIQEQQKEIESLKAQLGL